MQIHCSQNLRTRGLLHTHVLKADQIFFPKCFLVVVFLLCWFFGGGWVVLFCFGNGGVTWMLKNNVGVSLRVCFVLVVFSWVLLGFFHIWTYRLK